MTDHARPQLASHLRRHARRLYRIACGFGRERDAEDILQTLYTRWWRRMVDEPAWTPPEGHVELYVCVRRVVIDLVTKERRDRDRAPAIEGLVPIESAEESLHAFERLQWILSWMPPHLAEVLVASLSAGRRHDAEVAEELGLTTAAFTARLFKARRAAEDLAKFYELLTIEQANLLAELRYGAKTRAQIASELGLHKRDISSLWQEALAVLERNGRVA